MATFFRSHLGHRFASSVLMDPISKKFVGELESFAKREQVPVIQFRKGERKDDVAAGYRKKFSKPEGVMFIVYCVDRDFGPFFLKFSSYFPFSLHGQVMHQRS